MRATVRYELGARRHPAIRPGTAAVGLLLCLPGCHGGNDDQSPPPRLVPAMSPVVLDVPVPADFTYLERESSELSSGGSRWVTHYYEGSASPISVVAFYQEQMPLSRWKLVNRQTERGVRTLRFEKSREGCEVRITPKRKLGRSVEVFVTIYPRGEGISPPEKGP